MASNQIGEKRKRNGGEAPRSKKSKLQEFKTLEYGPIVKRLRNPDSDYEDYTWTPPEAPFPSPFHTHAIKEPLAESNTDADNVKTAQDAYRLNLGRSSTAVRQLYDICSSLRAAYTIRRANRAGISDPGTIALLQPLPDAESGVITSARFLSMQEKSEYSLSDPNHIMDPWEPGHPWAKFVRLTRGSEKFWFIFMDSTSSLKPDFRINNVTYDWFNQSGLVGPLPGFVVLEWFDQARFIFLDHNGLRHVPLEANLVPQPAAGTEVLGSWDIDEGADWDGSLSPPKRDRPLHEIPELVVYRKPRVHGLTNFASGLEADSLEGKETLDQAETSQDETVPEKVMEESVARTRDDEEDVTKAYREQTVTAVSPTVPPATPASATTTQQEAMGKLVESVEADEKDITEAEEKPSVVQPSSAQTEVALERNLDPQEAPSKAPSEAVEEDSNDQAAWAAKMEESHERMIKLEADKNKEIAERLARMTAKSACQANLLPPLSRQHFHQHSHNHARGRGDTNVAASSVESDIEEGEIVEAKAQTQDSPDKTPEATTGSLAVPVVSESQVLAERVSNPGERLEDSKRDLLHQAATLASRIEEALVFDVASSPSFIPETPVLVRKAPSQPFTGTPASENAPYTPGVKFEAHVGEPTVSIQSDSTTAEDTQAPASTEPAVEKSSSSAIDELVKTPLPTEHASSTSEVQAPSAGLEPHTTASTIPSLPESTTVSMTPDGPSVTISFGGVTVTVPDRTSTGTIPGLGLLQSLADQSAQAASEDEEDKCSLFDE